MNHSLLIYLLYTIPYNTLHIPYILIYLICSRPAFLKRLSELLGRDVAFQQVRGYVHAICIGCACHMSVLSSSKASSRRLFIACINLMLTFHLSYQISTTHIHIYSQLHRYSVGGSRHDLISTVSEERRELVMGLLEL